MKHWWFLFQMAIKLAIPNTFDDFIIAILRQLERRWSSRGRMRDKHGRRLRGFAGRGALNGSKPLPRGIAICICIYGSVPRRSTPPMVWWDLKITRYLQHLEALRLQLPAICCIWEKSSLVYTLFAAFGSSQALTACYLLHMGEVKPCLDAIRIYTIWKHMIHIDHIYI